MGINWIWIAAAVAAVVAFFLLSARRRKSTPVGESAVSAGTEPERRTASEPSHATVSAPGKPVESVHAEGEPRAASPGPVVSSVPVSQVVHPVAAAPAASAPQDGAPGKPLILVAEDNPSNYKLVEVLLRNDYTLLHAENGMEAVELYEAHRPSMVLMDISMPVMDGYEALKGIRLLNPAARVLALTAYAFEADRQKMLQSGFDGCLAKPLDVQELKRMIRCELDKA